MVLTGTLEELSSQQRSKKIGDGTERKETELKVMCCRDSGKNEQKRRERDRARRAAQTASERQATSQQRSTNVKEW